ncbi:MAG: formylglycine-generating enzyme family protein [Candidatus Competibacteraceae bacterium]|nr:MAG: formylglycine-generating enzyme family protein [Candidatus Competibacteraceae bacterium]
MQSRWPWIGLGIVLGLTVLPVWSADPDPEAVRRLMEKYRREATKKPPPTPKPVTKPAPKPRSRPAPKPRSKPTPNPVSTPVMSSRVDVPEMVRIPGGCFQMGSPNWEEGRLSDERQHRVCVEAFEIGVYEVTQGRWRAVMGDNPSRFKDSDNYPVEQVTWNDIQTYLQKLNARTGRNYRLPTEAEWEYACRGGVTGQRYCGGNDPERLAWHGDNSGVRTHPVGQKAANGFGLYDMSGNVWEWTCSSYDESYGGAEIRCADSNTGGPLAVRGGSWFHTPAWVLSAARFGNTPTSRNNTMGFRLARSL